MLDCKACGLIAKGLSFNRWVLWLLVFSLYRDFYLVILEVFIIKKENFFEPKVAVLLAAYNGMQWIEEQVDSILKQDGVHVTIFVSVDLSSDGTYEWFKKKEEVNSQIVVLPYGERFGGAAPNFFRLIRDVDFSEFDYVSLADQDDIWIENKVLRACELISRYGWDVVSSDVTAFWGGGRKKLLKKSYHARKYDHFFEAAGPGCTYVFNRKSANAFKSFLVRIDDKVNKISLHDWLAYAFCREHGFKWHIDNVPLMLYRQHASNQVGVNEGFNAYRKRIRLIFNGWYRKQVELVVGLVAPEKAHRIFSCRFLFLNCTNLRRRPRDNFFLILLMILRIF